MSLKKTLAQLLIYAVLEVGAIGGVPMTPDKIREIMQMMNRARVERVVKTESGEGPPEGSREREAGPDHESKHVMSYDIQHKKAASRFETTVEGSVAYVAYELKPGSIVFTHTIVPDQLSGRGIAGELTKHVLDHAREQKLTVVPQCSYIASWIERHPEYEELLRDKGE